MIVAVVVFMWSHSECHSLLYAHTLTQFYIIITFWSQWLQHHKHRCVHKLLEVKFWTR